MTNGNNKLILPSVAVVDN